MFCRPRDLFGAYGVHSEPGERSKQKAPDTLPAGLLHPTVEPGDVRAQRFSSGWRCFFIGTRSQAPPCALTLAQGLALLKVCGVVLRAQVLIVSEATTHGVVPWNATDRPRRYLRFR